MFVSPYSVEGQSVTISIRACVFPHSVVNSALHSEDALVQSAVSSVVG